MSLTWRDYDNFDWAGSKQLPMSNDQREAVAELTAEVLGLSPEDRVGVWGEASPPGRFAATVIRVLPGLPHGYRQKAAGVEHIGVKVFKTTADARREAEKVVP